MSKESLLRNPTAIANYLTDMFDKNDLSSILDAIKFVMQSQNVKALAETTGMRRDGLYKTFDGRKDPQLSRILKLFEGMDVQIVVKPLPAKQRPPRPALGV
jgi:probable addiction module antidote protein